MKITSIKIRRITAGIDSNKAIKELNISKSMFYKIEQGWKKPGSKLIYRMARLYECTTDDIYQDLKIIE